jgi:hypothetical protein
LTPNFEGFWLLPHTECAVNETKQTIYARPELKVGGGCFWAHMYAFHEFWLCYEFLKILRRVNFCTAYSVYVEKFLPHTQYR